MWYTIKRTKNIFTISKTGVNPVNVVVYKQDSCLNDTFVEVIPLQTTSTSIDVTLSKGDGVYKFVISSVVGRDVESVDILIPYYDGMLVSLIQDIDNILCGCECKTCDDCDSKDEIKNTLLKIFSYYILNNMYCPILASINNCIKCDFIDVNKCIITNEMITGSGDYNILHKKIITIFYLLFYYYDKNLYGNEYANDKYKYNKIIKCIKKLGIDLDCIKNNIKFTDGCTEELIPKITNLCSCESGCGLPDLVVPINPLTGEVNFTFTVPYTGGNGATFPTQIIDISAYTIYPLVLTLHGGTLSNNMGGELTYSITGTILNNIPICTESFIYAAGIRFYDTYAFDNNCLQWKIYGGTHCF